MPSRRAVTLSALLTALALPGSAEASFFGAEAIDGGADVVRVGDVDIARDGSGAVVYVRNEDGVPHVWASRLVSGVWQPPEKLDVGLTAPAAQPVVAASDNGRLLIAFTSGGQLFDVIRPAGAPGFTQPQLLATSAGEPSADLSINGAGYVSFTTPGASAADVRVARLERDAQAMVVLPDVLDIDPGADAGTGTGRSRVAISADGTAVVVWGEGGHVFGRRVFDQRVSVAPQDLTLGGTADLPEVDIEDDSSFAWVAFRQRLEDGRAHTVSRRLVGSQFEAAAQVDGFGTPASDDATGVRVDLSGRGEGIVTTSSGAAGAFVSLIHDNTPFPANLVNAGNAIPPNGVGGIAENNDAFVAYMSGSGAGDATVRMRPYDIDPAKRTVPGAGPEAVISNPDFGPVDPNGGLDAGVNRAGDAVAVFVQGTGDQRRLVSGGYDRPPGTFRTYTASKYRSLSKTPLAWGSAFDLWGPISYSVVVDGQVLGQTTETKLSQLKQVVRPGQHQWKVIASDRRGQTVSSPMRPLRVDGTPPDVSFTLSGSRSRGKTVTVKASASDEGSGIKAIKIDFGDGFVVQGLKRTAKHAYRTGRTYTIRVSATDRAGNGRAATRKVKIKKK